MGRRAALAALIAAALVTADGLRAPDRQFGTPVVLAGIHLYQATVSRLFAVSGVACRFTPTCSHYAEACVERFGWARGGGLALRRVLRCGPWTPLGTLDPPPGMPAG